MADKKPTRPSRHESEKPGAGRPSVERAMALRDVLTHAVEVEKDARKHSGPPRNSGAGRVIAVMLSVPTLVFSIYSYVARPEFIWGPNETNVTAVRRDANLRFTMFLLSQRIRVEGRAKGRLPATLEEVGQNPRGITYRVVSDTVFELRSVENGQVVVFRSDEPPRQFLGDVQKYITGRGP